jgi:hypothetical protein
MPQVCDGVGLNLYFRGCVSQVQLMITVVFTEEGDMPIWLFHSSCQHSVRLIMLLLTVGVLFLYIFLWLLVDS